MDSLKKWIKNAVNECMARHAEKFGDYVNEKPRRRTPQEWAMESVGIAARNGGVLPSTNWLNRNGYSGLVAAKRKRPELFGGSTTEISE